MCMNVLTFDSELREAEKLIRTAAMAGVDALIIQDVGIMRLARSIAPALPVHASTQMSITDVEGALFAESLGCDTVVVGRELSISDIAAVREGLPYETRIEAFVHGALCVSYSGQCFSSEAWGGRSANRGQCAQACRMPYGLLVDGQLTHILDDAKYLLSPQDLMGLDRVGEMVKAGVDTFKIEGRLKGPEFVYTTTAAYREAIDREWAALAGRPLAEVREGEETTFVPTREELAQIFARGQDADYDGLTTGFLDGAQVSLTHASSPPPLHHIDNPPRTTCTHCPPLSSPYPHYTLINTPPHSTRRSSAGSRRSTAA